MKTHGDSGWETYPSYLDILVPRALEFLDARDLTITFFIVGQDAALEKNHGVIKAIAEAGHEIGNHSFKHEQWLHLYTLAEIDADLAEAERHIERVTGQKPIGFRGPGYSCSKATLQVLAERSYQYDCSTFPTFLGPLARAYYFMTAKLSPEEKEERKKLFGTLKDGLRSNKPYQWKLNNGQLTEIPVTTIPFLKVPFHISYILYLSSYSKVLALAYFRIALVLCRMTNTQPSILLHPLDFLGAEDAPELAFFPAMNMPSQEKMEVVSKALQLLETYYSPVTMRQHAVAVSQSIENRLIEPKFETG
jgi:peptidoglycan/xylan/chitin deacetylase (PgdA/CDA1 family)